MFYILIWISAFHNTYFTHFTSACSSVKSFVTTCYIDIAGVGNYEIHSDVDSFPPLSISPCADLINALPRIFTADVCSVN